MTFRRTFLPERDSSMTARECRNCAVFAYAL
nr:MAG TPA: leader polypeptide [Caudoviricetes sp.]